MTVRRTSRCCLHPTEAGLGPRVPAREADCPVDSRPGRRPERQRGGRGGCRLDRRSPSRARAPRVAAESRPPPGGASAAGFVDGRSRQAAPYRAKSGRTSPDSGARSSGAEDRWYATQPTPELLDKARAAPQSGRPAGRAASGRDEKLGDRGRCEPRLRSPRSPCCSWPAAPRRAEPGPRRRSRWSPPRPRSRRSTRRRGRSRCATTPTARASPSPPAPRSATSTRSPPATRCRSTTTRRSPSTWPRRPTPASPPPRW